MSGPMRDFLAMPQPVSVGAGAAAFAVCLAIAQLLDERMWFGADREGLVLLALVIGVMTERGVRLLVECGMLRTRLDESRRRLEDVIATSSDWIWETNAQGHFVFLSHSVEDVLHRSVDDLVGRTRHSLAATQSDQERLDEMQALVDTREPFRDVIYGTRNPNGDIRYLRISGRPRWGWDGTFLGYIGTGSDLTEETLAANRLQEAEARLSLALESMAEGIALFDVSGRLVLHNDRLRRLLRGTTAVLSKKTTVKQLLLAAADTADEVRPLLARRFANQLKPIILKTNGGRWLSCRMVPARDNGTLTLWADVTAEVKARQEAERLELQSRQTQKLEAIGTLAGGIAHEINTPIQFIGDNLTFLRTAFDDIMVVVDAVAALRGTHATVDDAWDKADMDFLREDVPLALEQSRDGIRSVAAIVLAMKEFAHPSAKEPVSFDINHVLHSTATVCRNEWKHVAMLDFDLAPSMPPVVGVPGEINQVFLNIIVNAAQAIEESHTKDGRITLATRVVAGQAEIRISDNGPGIPAAIRERIFDPFFTTKPVGEGTGQGLAIAHDIIVCKHGGSLTVDGAPGGGTAFTIRLPLPDAETVAIPALPAS